jgi:cytochrome P450
MSQIKGPMHIPLLGWRYRGLQMLRDPMGFFTNLHKKYGELCFWDPKNPKHVCLFGPEMNKYVFTRPDIFIVDAFRESRLPRNSAIERLSFGLMRLNGETHTRHRKLMQPAFRSTVVNTYWQAVVDETNKEISTWQFDEIRDINKDLIRLITNISLKTMFGIDEVENNARLQKLMEELLVLATSPLSLLVPYSIPGFPYYKMLKIADEIELIIKKMIKNKIGKPANDVLSILVNSHTDEHGGLSEDELISEAYTVLCHESVAATMSWLLVMLDRNPDIYKKLTDELAILKGNPVSVDNIKELKYLDNVVKESVRLLPPSGFNLRYLSQDHEISGVKLKEGTMVFLSSYVTHRYANIFDKPLQFSPERWDVIQPSPYEYMPFGCGTHSCIGKYFAQLEIKVILSMILQRYQLSIQSGAVIDRGMRVSMVPKHGLPMKLNRTSDNITQGCISGNIFESVEIK